MRIAQSGLRASRGMPVGTGPTDGTPPADAKALTNEVGRSVMQQIAAHIEPGAIAGPESSGRARS